MAATVASDFVFDPKVWSDHVMAYFRKKLVYGAFAFTDDTLTTSPGLTINFPYFKTIGDAEEPAENEGLSVDNLTDDSFSATVKEIGKAVGIKKKAFKKSAAATDRITANAQMQIGRRMAEKVDADLLAEFSAAGNFVNGFTAASAPEVMTVKRLAAAKYKAFGDRGNEAVVAFLHSRQWLDLLRDDTFAALRTDNTVAPEMITQGMMTSILGMAIVVVDTIPLNGSQIASTDAYRAFLHKPEAYGFITKQDAEMESDYDILAREWIFTGNQWYAVKSFHGKQATDDLRTCEIITTIGA